MSKLFTEFQLNSPRGQMTLANRMIVAPMCQYSSEDGLANDWHLTHWTNLMNSGAGAVIIEATGVTADGRITPNCLGIWNDAGASDYGAFKTRQKISTARLGWAATVPCG